MRVAHVTPAFFSDQSLIGGGERYVGNVVRAIQHASQKHNLPITQEVFCIGTAYSTEIIGGIRHTFLQNDSPSVHPMAAIADALWVELDNFDIVHVYQGLTYFGAFVGCLAKDLGKKLVFTDLGGGQNPLLLNFDGVNIADGVVSISNFASSLLGASFKGLQEVIIGPIDSELFSRDYRFKRKPKTLLCVGRLLPHKGIDMIIRAVPENHNLFVVGRPYDQEYFDLLKYLAKGKNVHFKTDINDDELIEIYSTASLFVHAATHMDVYGREIRNPELMGLSTLEALSCGLPACVSNTASLPELAPVGSYFKIFNDVDELHNQILELSDGEWGNEHDQVEAANFIKSNYSLDIVGNRFFDFYGKI